MTRALLQQALDALEPISAFGRVGTKDVEQAKLQQAITALREALTAPEQEPVGTVYTMEALVPGGDVRCHVDLHKALPAGTKLYAAPPAAPAPVPDGMVMVPREPTPEMLAVVRNGPMHETWTEGYCAMIAASPAAPVVKDPLTPVHMLYIGRKYFGSPTPKAWFDAAREVEAAHGITGGKP